MKYRAGGLAKRLEDNRIFKLKYFTSYEIFAFQNLENAGGLWAVVDGRPYYRLEDAYRNATTNGDRFFMPFNYNNFPKEAV